MAKIAIDCDGVLADFTKAFFEEANSIWPGRCDVNYQPKSWDDFPDLNHAEMTQVWDKIRATQNWWMKCPAYGRNVAALCAFFYTNRGHDVHIVTSRTPTLGSSTAFQTWTWLRACGIDPFHNYFGVITVDNWPDKRPIYKAAGIEYSVDDKPETIIACDTLDGHKAYLLERSWNTEAKVKNRVPDLATFLQRVVELKVAE